MNFLSVTCAAVSERSEPFLAFVPKFLSADAVTVAGLKIDMYASTSGCGGGPLYLSLLVSTSFSLLFVYTDMTTRGADVGTTHGRAVLIPIPVVQTILTTLVDHELHFAEPH